MLCSGEMRDCASRTRVEFFFAACGFRIDTDCVSGCASFETEVKQKAFRNTPTDKKTSLIWIYYINNMIKIWNIKYSIFHRCSHKWEWTGHHVIYERYFVFCEKVDLVFCFSAYGIWVSCLGLWFFQSFALSSFLSFVLLSPKFLIPYATLLINNITVNLKLK